MLKNVTLLLLILTTPILLKSQTFVMDGTPIASCEGTFTDSGDTFSNYAANENFTTTICQGDTIEFSASVNEINANSTLSVTANPVSFQTPFVHINSAGLSLPDGSGASYQSSISITDFAPNMTLDNTNMLTNICVVMEHSWMRDLEIVLTCPNGQSILLHDHPGQTGERCFGLL